MNQDISPKHIVLAVAAHPDVPPRLTEGPAVGTISETTVDFAAKTRTGEAKLAQRLGLAIERAAAGEGAQAEVAGIAKSLAR